MIFDKRKAVSVILSKMDKDGRSTDVEVKPESGEHNEYTALAEDLLAAVKDSSVQKLAGFLKSFHALIQEVDQVQDKEG